MYKERYMESRLDRKLKADSGWEEWSNYVLITLEKLSKEINQRDKERTLFREKMLMDLINLKESLVKKIAESEKTNKINIDKIEESLVKNISEYEKTNKINIDEIVKKIETMINEVSGGNTALSDKFIVFKEDVITPLRIKVAVLSTLGGVVGGAIVYIVLPFIVKFLSGS